MPTTTKPRSAIFRTAELAVGGDLRSYLRQCRRKGQSFNDIAIGLRDHGVIVTYEGVRSWCARLAVV